MNLREGVGWAPESKTPPPELKELEKGLEVEKLTCKKSRFKGQHKGHTRFIRVRKLLKWKKIGLFTNDREGMMSTI